MPSMDRDIETENGLDWEFQAQPLPTSCHPLNQVPHSLVQPDLECFQKWGTNSFTVQLASAFKKKNLKNHIFKLRG